MATATQRHPEMSVALTVLNGKPLEQFATLTDMLEAYALRKHLGGAISLEFARFAAKNAYTYQPHLYRGGYVIPGFGYSVERIGVYVAEEFAGHPELVKRTR